jgi:hypothetical protein
MAAEAYFIDCILSMSLAICTGVELVLDEQYHLVFQSLLQPMLVKDLFASS